MKNEEMARLFSEATPYIQKYHGKTMVVKYGGNAMINEELKNAVMNDLVTLTLLGVRVVLVHGGGPIGLIVANIAKSRGATVIVSEPNESRLAMAKDFGADYSINPMKEDLDAFINKLTDGEGVNVIFEAAGIPALLAHATSQLSPAGRLVAMTFGKEPIPVNFKEINAKELTILGTRHQYQKFPEVVKILPDHLKEVDEITTHVFKAEDFQKAFDTLADRNSGAGKVVLTFA